MQTRKYIKCFHSKAVLSVFLNWIFFFLSGFSSRTLTIRRTAEERRRPSFIPLYHFHPLTNIETFICMWVHYHVFLIATLVFTRLLLDEIYHLIELPFEWLIDDVMFVCLLDELMLGFFLQRFDIANRWIWTRIDYHPCITNEPTNQVCKCANVWKTPVEEGHFK